MIFDHLNRPHLHRFRIRVLCARRSQAYLTVRYFLQEQRISKRLSRSNKHGAVDLTDRWGRTIDPIENELLVPRLGMGQIDVRKVLLEPAVEP